MLEKLTPYRTLGSATHLSVIVSAIIKSSCTFEDLLVIANSISSVEIPCVDATIAFLEELGLCSIHDDRIKGTPTLIEVYNTSQPFELAIGYMLLERMLEEGIIRTQKVRYDPIFGTGYIVQTDIPLHYSQMRNYLIDSKVVNVDNNRIFFNKEANNLIKKAALLTRDGMTPSALLRKLEQDRKTGERAEKYVLEFERKRLGQPIADSVQQVSHISVSAGYDIASFNSNQSMQHDRFIEVKAIGHDQFFFSANELRTARALGPRYFLYLVDLQKANNDNYSPEIIPNPASFFSESTEWRITPENYRINRIT